MGTVRVAEERAEGQPCIGAIAHMYRPKHTHHRMDSKGIDPYSLSRT